MSSPNERPAPRHSAVLFAIGGITVVILASHLGRAYRRRRSMPPGPRGLPFIGNLLDVPTKFSWLKYAEWRGEHGPVFSLDVAGQAIVVLNSHKAASDILEKRYNMYSDRPQLVIACEIMMGGLALLFNDYNKVWSRRRRAVHEAIGARISSRYQSSQAREAATSVLHFLNAPSDLVTGINELVAANIVSVIYGIPRTAPLNQQIGAKMKEAIAGVQSAMVPGKYLVDTFPILRYLPSWLVPGMREGLAFHRQSLDFFTGLVDRVRVQSAPDAEAIPSFVGQLLDDPERHELDDAQRAWLAGEMCMAGTDTTAAALQFFVLAMTLHSDVVRRAQAELDMVVGRDRLPTFQDRNTLPYIRAIVKETLRWYPVVPTVIRCLAKQDDWYDGYLIPKGSIVIANIWSMNRDPAIYDNPEEFRPERFLDASGAVNFATPGAYNTGHVSFGFGRRVCSGATLATQMLFINIATLLFAFNFEPPTGADGNVVLPDPEAIEDSGATASPKHFTVNLTPRFPGVGAVTARALDMMGD